MRRCRSGVGNVVEEEERGMAREMGKGGKGGRGRGVKLGGIRLEGGGGRGVVRRGRRQGGEERGIVRRIGRGRRIGRSGLLIRETGGLHVRLGLVNYFSEMFRRH